MKTWAALAVLLLVVAMTSVATAGEWKIAAWSQNTPEGVAQFGIRQLRTGCNDTPDVCVGRVEAIAKNEGVNDMALSIAKVDSASIANYAQQYSALSMQSEILQELSIDDFVAFMHRTRPDNLVGIVDSEKSMNKTLRFSVTIYEDNLSNIAKNAETYSDDIRSRIDRVYLYIHYRENGQKYVAYVKKAHALFPNAEIFGGVYAYDRIDYIPCAPGPSAASCSQESEIALFRDALQQQIALLRSGELAGLEYYPGQFGREEQWNGWDNPRICRPERKAECIENTIEMRRIAAAMVNTQ